MNRIRVAVTGAAGQVGSVLVKRMLEFPHIDTVAICRNSINAGIVHSSAPRCSIRIGSIIEIESAQKLLGDCDIIVNCALAMVSGNPRMSRLLNRVMIDNFSYLEKLKSLIHMSSVSVYGACIDNANPRKSTFERPYPDDDYGRSKLYIEQYAKHMCLSKQLSYYMLRLGHVIGVRMDRSRQIILLAQNKNFHLPFNGDLASNTINVEHLAAKIVCIISHQLPSGIYNVADTQQTWRHVFDWHTQATGLPPVKGLSKERSNYLKHISSSNSVTRDIRKWLGSMPILDLLSYPEIFKYAYRLLAVAPQPITERLKILYKNKNVKNQIAMITKNSDELLSSAYFSDAMPGRYLEIPSGAFIGLPPPEKQSDQLREWYKRFSQPTWLPNSRYD